MKCPVLVCCTLLTLVFAWRVGAQSQAVPEDVRAFAARYVSAVNAKDPSQIRALYTLKALACITPQNKDFYDTVMPIHASDHVPAGYTISLMPVNEGNLKAVGDYETFPVKPVNELHIDYQQGEESGTVIIYLVRENGRWIADFPCATETALKQFREEASERARYKTMADGIQQPLRGELIAMLRKHNVSSAIDRYHQASGQDLKTSMLVINNLEDQMNAQ